jgi:outer membrane protein assembly factor BamD (BamD/ComL family)
MKRAAFFLFAIVLLVSGILSCKTVPTDIPPDMSQSELIQEAQEAADDENWDAALAYYQALIDRYPQDRSATVAAQYEMAFIEYKRGDIEAAQSGFEQLLGVYDFEAEALPAWPRVLAERILEEIAAEQAEAASTAAE